VARADLTPEANCSPAAAGLDNGAGFDQHGNQIDPAFVECTGARDARRIRLGVRADF
jgi:hypothetical protein